jgi:DNA-binding CsgD family transcriptional regulator
MAIAGGATPAEAAAQLGIAVPTVRTHLKAVFLKTATERQAELVRTLSALLAVAGREGGTYV